MARDIMAQHNIMASQEVLQFMARQVASYVLSQDLGAEEPSRAAGTWSTLPPMPASLGEVSAGYLLDGAGRAKVVVVGEGDPGTYIYDVASRKWSSGAKRPKLGHHVAAEVIDGRLYLFGGLAGSGGKLQIYDVDTNRWSFGADLPYKVGSASTARIGNFVYLCGGIIEATNTTTSGCIKYNIRANKWEAGVAPMPLGVNHAASATDGERVFVVGGRVGGNVVSEGLNAMQVYDPVTNRWTAGPPLPERRGGVGRAVILRGKLYVLGGETNKKGPDAKAGLTAAQVYNRVDVYDIVGGRWGQGAPMPVPRHGIYPVSDGQGAIYVVGGGVKRAKSASATNDVFRPFL